MTAPVIDLEAFKAICSRLSELPLTLPRALQEQDKDDGDGLVLTHLQKLIAQDPAVFLERHGAHLHASELKAFEPLDSDYEVSFWIKQLKAAGEPGQAKSRGQLCTSTKNRRLAALELLRQDGDYFSMESMRDREPLLYHQMVGQFHNTPTSFHGTLSETLMKQHDECLLRTRMEEEKEVEEGQVSEHESDDDDDEEEEGEKGEEEEIGKKKGVEDGDAAMAMEDDPCARMIKTDEDQEMQPGSIALGGSQQVAPLALDGGHILDEKDLAVKQKEFTEEMESRYLLGLDKDYDYKRVDEDRMLDDHWIHQMGQDAEDRYFSEDSGDSEGADASADDDVGGRGDHVGSQDEGSYRASCKHTRSVKDAGAGHKMNGSGTASARRGGLSVSVALEPDQSAVDAMAVGGEELEEWEKDDGSYGPVESMVPSSWEINMDRHGPKRSR